jgi:hypothetical protein
VQIHKRVFYACGQMPQVSQAPAPGSGSAPGQTKVQELRHRIRSRLSGAAGRRRCGAECSPASARAGNARSAWAPARPTASPKRQRRTASLTSKRVERQSPAPAAKPWPRVAAGNGIPK